MARLQILSGKREGDFLDLGPGTHQIGTRRAAEIQLRDREIAYKHTNIIVEPTGLWVEDLGSTKGTILNGQKLAENAKTQVHTKDKVLVGSTEMLVVDESAGAASLPASGGAPPAGAASASPADESGEQPARAGLEPARPPAPAPAAPPPASRPSPASSRTGSLAGSEAGASATAAWPTLNESPAQGGDPAALEAELKELRRKLDTKQKENDALMKALEGSSGPEEDDDSHGYMPAELSGDLEVRVVDLQQQADELQSQLLEKDAALKAREAELEAETGAVKKELAAEKKKRSALERDVQRHLEAREGATGDEKKRLEEIRTYEEANTQLVLENDELKERLEALRYQVDQEASRRGELVRERVRELHAENKRLVESNAELRTLVEACEEKIDELDERLEELEGENEELERLLDEVRADLAKVRSERETMQKTLRQKTTRLEERLQELEAENVRARAAGDRAAPVPTPTFAATVAGGNGVPEVEVLRSRLARLEALFDDVETVESAKKLEARVKELEGESAGLRKRLEGKPASGDAADLDSARARVEELEKRARLDEKKLERLERKNRELVRANVAAEMAAAEKARGAEQKPDRTPASRKA